MGTMPYPEPKGRYSKTGRRFADGHSEYWKWKDPRTVEVARMDRASWLVWTGGGGRQSDVSPGNQDLHRVQKAVWGKLGYTPGS